ncbi:MULTISPECIES: winged helix-turn-helix domain-containing protein [Variovorax]|jgi:two-component system copper resistance phosphate regulon response regulator CusR|uniref:winged helix-turn-helix domain-containing protein n=1 Tax=Variovorax TaxID=34072 RepID=UPI002864D776|nr:winged helix-turn-helix domain-containing protein [Variovorax sp. 3319]MDR6889384.1 two-component system copper resistance phosphate regulon response regulator CusR [Variovorax sp. 3319]
MRILVIEGEPQLGDQLKKGLEENGYTVDVARDGAKGRNLSAEHTYGLILLDAVLPGADGFAVLRAIRRTSTVPVLVLTVRDRVEDRVNGLRQGADEYLVKPFTLPELLARVRALLQRGKPNEPTIYRLADLELDLASRKCVRNHQRIDLTAKEFTLLAVLLRRSGQIVTRSTLAEEVWDTTLDSDTNAVEVAIRRLRSKIDDPFELKLLHTVRGSGYVLEDRSWP